MACFNYLPVSRELHKLLIRAVGGDILELFNWTVQTILSAFMACASYLSIYLFMIYQYININISISTCRHIYIYNLYINTYIYIYKLYIYIHKLHTHIYIYIS